MAEQTSEEFETPDRSGIPDITRAHVSEMESSNADGVWVRAGMAHMLVRTIGRKSGKEHKVALPYWLDGDERPIVVASYAGADVHPAWFHNLADKTANPELFCRFQHEDFWAEVVILDGEEYASIWEALTRDRPFYCDYQKLTERRLPLVRFVKKRGA
ncbi:MAG: nitroreductase/quinone reductase family protein [Myxococcota bacterium]|nr:nitroreductase/quinone reductase family protein [Myxococcota bacterium]